MIEAEAQLRKGLDLLARLPDRTERRRHELDLKIALAASLIATRGYMAPEVAEIYARVRTLCDELDEPSQLGWVLAGQWSYHLVRHEFTLALRDANELLALSQTRNDAFIKQAACYANSRLIIVSATSLRLGSTQNVMRVATHMDHVQLPMLLPGITATTSPTDYFLLKQFQMFRFDGANWVPFGPIIGG